MKNYFKALLIIGMCAGIYANNAIAGDDDIAGIVVDNGTPISVPEPSTLPLLLAGVIGVAAVRLLKRKK